MNAQGKREKWKPQQYVEHIKKIMSDLDAHRLVPDLRGTLGMPVGTCIAEGRLDDSRKQREFQSFGSSVSAVSSAGHPLCASTFNYADTLECVADLFTTGSGNFGTSGFVASAAKSDNV